MRLAYLLVPLALVACGGSGGGGNQAPAEIDLTATGATAGGTSVNITMPSGGQVHFVNKDTKPHQPSSSSCAELNTAQLAPNADSGLITVTTQGSCTFNDSLNPTNAAYSGSITVLPPGNPGNGY